MGRIIILCVCLSYALAWENLPQLPSNRRSQYYLLETDGGYKYGFDTGDNFFAKQSGNAQNQVEGHFKYNLNGGKTVDVRYTSGVQGYVPSGLEGLQGLTAPSSSYAPQYDGPSSYAPSGSGSSNNDGSYSFSYDTGTSSRQESADVQGNVRGSYAYTNAAGKHYLKYVAGSSTGFLPTGGSLSIPNGLGGQDSSSLNTYGGGSNEGRSSYNTPTDGSGTSDGSYSFSYNTGDSSREETADANNNVKGRYSYTNSAGQHDLSYVAGAQIGFLPTGGSLAEPNGLGGKSPSSGTIVPNARYGAGGSGSGGAPVTITGADGSYSFSYNTGDSSREESADSQNNVKGRYSYTNAAGNHDLSYVAGSQTGFLPTGGSLATPNGLGGKSSSYGAGYGYAPSAPSFPSSPGGASNADGSYSFSYNTGDSSREESADSKNNVKGRYSYTNSAGRHDLSYVAGAQTGFLPTGGSLAMPNGLSEKSSQPSYGEPSGLGSRAITGPGTSNADGSYSFSYNTGDSSREESADSQNNVKGRYAYTNAAGHHDLSYIAGAQTGFLPTGGSLATPNGLGGKGGTGTVIGGRVGSASDINNSAANDGSYSFSYSTGDSSRQESADSQNNVKGSYSYTNTAGFHDLSYVAGSQTGFLPTGGSLATPNGLGGKIASGSPTSQGHPKLNNEYLPPPTSKLNNEYLPPIKGGSSKPNSYTTGNVVVQTYLPPSNGVKFGYIFDSKQ